jgi:hypothetical protein
MDATIKAPAAAAPVALPVVREENHRRRSRADR